MRHRIVLISLALAATSAMAASGKSLLPGPAFPIPSSPVALQADCDRHLATARQAVRRIERRPADAGWLAAYDDMNGQVEDLSSPVFLLSNVHPDKAMREAAEACELKWQGFFSALNQNETLYRAVRKVRPRDAVDAELRKRTLESFEDSGVGLPGDKRARAKAISDRVTELNQAFDRNIRDANLQLAFTEAQLKGVPEAVWKSAPRDAEGRVLLGVDYPVYVPVMQAAAVPATRERMWRAKTDEGGARNIELLAEIAALRREYAQLFGFPSYADFVLRRRMARSPDEVQRFLEGVRNAVTARERREVDELREAKARDLGLALADVRLERWDFSYYTERVKRERYSVDQEAFRPYFPPQQSIEFVMRVIEKSMGLRYTRVPDVKLWHPDAQAYVASDAKTGRALATLYIDPYPREGKYNHAAVWPIRGGAVRTGRAPQAALVVNLDRKGLNLDEIETLLHEFGHAVHNNLSTTRHVGGNGVLDDFVEAPSQMLEEWVYDPRVLAAMREVCPACAPVPDDLLAKAKVAERYGKGTQYARQQLFASYDMALYGRDTHEPLALWARMEGASVLGHVPGTMFPAGFSHITASNYAAGYYGYLWSEVVAADLRTAFERDKFDPVVGRRYRDTVLAPGGERPPADLVREFLGRPARSDAFFDDLRR